MTTEMKEQCPAHRGMTGGSDSYSFNDEKNVGYCLSCGLKTWKFKGTLYGKYDDSGDAFKIEAGETSTVSPRSENKDNQVVDNFDAPPKADGEFVTARGITAQTMEKYGVKLYTNQPWQHYDPKARKVVEEGHSDEFKFVYPNGSIKQRRMDLAKDHPSHFAAQGTMNTLFGMNHFPKGCSVKLTVVEGEFDAMAAYQMLNTGQYLNPVVSVPAGTPSGAFWEATKGYFDSFNQIILSLDNDDVGTELRDKFLSIFPDKTYVVEHGDYKDANDFLINGDQQQYFNSWRFAKRHKPDYILSDADDFLKMYDESPNLEFFPTGIPELDDKLGGGISKGYLTLIQAETGVGKTQLMRMIEYSCFSNSQFKFATKHLEETHKESILGLVSYDLEQRLIDKSEIEAAGKTEEVKESIRKMTKDGRIVFYDIDPSDSNDDIIKKFRYLITAMEADYIFLEPIQDAVSGSNASEKEGRISDLVSRMGTLIGETGVGFVIIAHQNGDGGSMYSSMVTKKAGFKITLSGNRESEDLTERNKTYIKVEEKNRSGRGFGNAGIVGFDYDTYMLKPITVKEPQTSGKTGEF